jgi:biopolymer transport protein TolQ
MFSFFKTAAWQLIAQTDFLTKFILLCLFFVSVGCVAIIIAKIITFQKHRKQFEVLLKRIRQIKNFNELIILGKEFKDTLGGKLIINNLGELKVLLDGNMKKRVDGQQEESLPTLTLQDLENLDIVLNQTISELLLEEETYLPVLGTSAAVGPLVGLFGTIWGLIQAFLDISQEHSADIATVAPGIAEALVATLGGLIVTIPAMIAFHYFSNQLRKFEYQLGEISDKFIMLARHTFLK